jgi:hypothetical protein
MGVRRTALLAALVAACAGASCASATSPRGSSDNWSGYAAFGVKFKSVRGSWVQPSAQCFGRSTSFTESSFWVGLGGNSRSSYKVEQIGTEADCNPDGTASYYAWYELWPADGVNLHLDIQPGDRIAARVDIGRASVYVSIRNQTTGRRFSKTIPMRNPDGTSAEWIAEAPAITVRHSDQIVPMADFGRIHFTNAAATSASGHTGPISDHDWHESAIEFRSDHGNPGDPVKSFLDSAAAAHGVPTELATGGGAFTIVWKRGFTGTKKSGAPTLAA